MYFGLLLIDEQIKLNNDLQTLLAGNESKLESMTEQGTASESDLQNVRAERLNAVQKATELASQKQMLQRMLSTFCGIEVNNIQKPQMNADGGLTAENHRSPLQPAKACAAPWSAWCRSPARSSSRTARPETAGSRTGQTAVFLAVKNYLSN
jgi:hypothetical protein